MKIFEVAQTPGATPSPEQLLGLVEFLAGRAEDTNSPKKISKEAFISLAQSLGINVTPSNLQQVIVQPPLSNILEPFDPQSNDIVYKGNGEEAAPTAMPVNKAQDIVAQSAKSAMNRDRGV